jgi:hypothetical protein
MRDILAIATILVVLAATGASAGPIENACRGSGRAGATPQLCACIQQAANLTLTRAEQRRAAKFFRDPHRAQEVRQSRRPGDSAFWQRYRAFGETAEIYCGGA